MSDLDKLASASLRVTQNAAHATLLFLVTSLYPSLFSKRLKVRHSVGDGVFCIHADHSPVDPSSLPALDSAVRDFCATVGQLEEVWVSRDALYSEFKRDGRPDKIGVLKSMAAASVKCIQGGGFRDYILEPMLTDLGQLTVFGFQPYRYGFVVRFPTLLSPNALSAWRDPSAQFEMLEEFSNWIEAADVDNVAKLNQLIFRRQLNDLKWPAEGRHTQKLAKIASALVADFARKRVVTISGPSSSSKTTFAKRLAIALRVLGHRSLVIEMDDFFINRADTPYGPDGLQDFEAITSLNVELLGERVHRLLNGESVPRRKYIFKTGEGVDLEKEMQALSPDMFLILEGIHGLNPILLEKIGREMVCPIYITPATALAIDDTHRFPSTDLRLLRRIVRDAQYRSASARKTIRRWTSVRVGEEKNIFPFQGNAEMWFNSALVYEIPVLVVSLRSLLAEATVLEEWEDPKDPMAHEVTREVRRLMALVNPFYAISLEEVPHISCLREFVGGSDLRY